MVVLMDQRRWILIITFATTTYAFLANVGKLRLLLGGANVGGNFHKDDRGYKHEGWMNSFQHRTENHPVYSAISGPTETRMASSPRPDARRKSAKIKQAEKLSASSSLSSHSSSSLSSSSSSSSSSSLLSLRISQLSPSELASTIYSIASNKTNLCSAEKQVITTEIRRSCEDFSTHSACDILWSLGTLRLSLRNKDITFIVESLLERLNQDKDKITASDMTHALVGLARLGVTWKRHPRKSFLSALRFVSPYMNEMQISYTVWAMGKTGVTWNDHHLDARTKRAIMTSVEKRLSGMDEYCIANTIHGLSNMKIKWSILTPSVTEGLIKSMLSQLKKMSEQEISNCISGLGRMEAKWDQVPSVLRKSIIERFVYISTMTLKNTPHIKESDNGGNDVMNKGYKEGSTVFNESHNIGVLGSMGLSMTIHGLAKMEVKWSQLPPSFRTTLLKSLVMIMPSANAQEVSNIIYGLGKLGIAYKDLNQQAKQVICTTWIREAWQMTSQGISNSLWGFQLMQVTFSEDLPGAARGAVWDGIRREGPRFDEQEIGNVVFSLSKMKCIFKSMPFAVRTTLLQSLTKELPVMEPQGVVMVLVGLSRLNVDWQSMSDDLKDRFVKASQRVLMTIENAETLSSMIYALSSIGLKWWTLETLYPHIQKAISEGIYRFFNEYEISSDTIEAITEHPQNLPEDVQDQRVKVFKESIPDDNKISRPMKLEQKEDYYSLNPFERVVAFPNFTFFSDVRDVEPDRKVSLIQNLRESDFYDERFENISASSVSLDSLLDNVRVEQNAKKSKLVKEISSDMLLSVKPADVRVYMNGNDMENNLSAKELARERIKTITIKERHIKKVSNLVKRSRPRRDLNPGNIKKLGGIAINHDIDHRRYRENQVCTKESKGNNGNDNDSNRSIRKRNKKKKGLHAFSMNALKDVNKNMTIADVVPNRDTASVPSLIYALGNMKADWNVLDDSVTSALSGGLADIMNARVISERLTVNSLHGLCSMNVKWRQLNPYLQKALLDQLLFVCEDLCEQGVSMTFLSLAKMEVHWEDDLSEKLKRHLRKSIYRQAQLGEHALSTLLYGLGKMGRHIDDLHPQVLSTLKEAIVVCHIGDKCSAKGVTNSMYGLALMSARWSKLSSSVRMALMNEIKSVASSLDETQLSNILWALGQLKASWLDLGCSEALLSVLPRRLRHMNEQHITTVVYSLGMLGVEWEKLPRGVSEGILNGLLRVARHVTLESNRYSSRDYTFSADGLGGDSSHLNEVYTDGDEITAQGVSMTLHGLSKMKVRLETLPEAVMKWQRDCIRRFSTSMNKSQLSTSIISLGKLGWRWEHLGQKPRKAILSTLPRIMIAADTKDISNIANGLGVMGATWNDLSRTLTDSMVFGLKKVARRGAPCELASVLYGVALMECQWEHHLDALIRSDVIEGIIKAANSNVDPQTIANLMYSLSLLVFDIDDTDLQAELSFAHIALLDAVPRIGMAKFSEKEREQILMYVHLLRTITSYESLVNTLGPIFRVAKSTDHHVEGHKSILEGSVIRALTETLAHRNKDLYIADEYSAFDGAFPVDGTIFDNADYENPEVFIEVDGPHHYKNGILRRKDKLKEMLYRKKYPLASFVRVNHEQVKHLGIDKIAFVIANFITLTHSHTDREKETMQNDEVHAFSARSAERELYKILNFHRREDRHDVSHFNYYSSRGVSSVDMHVYSIFGDVTWSNGDVKELML